MFWDKHVILCCGKNVVLADQSLLPGILLSHNIGLAILLSGGNVGTDEFWKWVVEEVCARRAD
jgi:hypothetical protein